MKIAVCVKQVPAVEEIQFDFEKRTIIREGVTLRINSFDRRSMGVAVHLRGQYGGQVDVITMGPPQARTVLVECLAAGADRAFHLVDRAFAGADTLATARALVAFLQRESYDIVFCGRNSLDAETGQVGPEVAELLGIPHISSIRKLEAIQDGKAVRVERELDDGYEVIECALPLLITSGEWLAPRMVPVQPEQLKEAEQSKPIIQVSAAELEQDLGRFGLAGSPTWVDRIESIAVRRDGKVIPGDDPQQAVRQLLEYLDARGAFRTEGMDERPRLAQPGPSRSDRKVWVSIEKNREGVRAVSLELLGKAAELAATFRGEVWAVVTDTALEEAALVAAHGADRVLVLSSPLLSPYTAETHCDAWEQAIAAYQPEVVVFPATNNGRDLAPRLAARLGLGLTADCIDLDIDEEGRLVQYKPAFGGGFVAPILSKTTPQMATVRPGVLRQPLPDSTRRAQVETLEVKPKPPVKRVISIHHEGGEDSPLLREALRVVCVGAGIGGPENLPAVRSLAEALNAPIACSLRVAALEWMPKAVHVGLTGKIIAPRLYLGVGVRGAAYHYMGIRKSEIVAAINNDPQADFVRTADVTVVADWERIVPVLTEALRARKGLRD